MARICPNQVEHGFTSAGAGAIAASALTSCAVVSATPVAGAIFAAAAYLGSRIASVITDRCHFDDDNDISDLAKLAIQVAAAFAAGFYALQYAGMALAAGPAAILLAGTIGTVLAINIVYSIVVGTSKATTQYISEAIQGNDRPRHRSRI